MSECLELVDCVILFTVIVYIKYIHFTPLARDVDDRDVARWEVYLFPMLSQYVTSDETK